MESVEQGHRTPADYHITTTIIMARTPTGTLPAMTLHKCSGQARVKFGHHHVYLGVYGTDAAKAKYDTTIGLWLGNGRRWPPPGASYKTIADLGDAYVAHCIGYYVKAGKTTNIAWDTKRAFEHLYRAGASQCAPEDFGPLALKGYQRWLAKEPNQRWSRSTINRYVRLVTQMIKWAVSEELIDASVYNAIQTVRPLPKGRQIAIDVPIAREGRKVTDIPDEHVQAVLGKVSPTIAAMIRLQLDSAMRPRELCTIRLADIRRVEVDGRTIGIYRVDPDINKAEHHGRDRIAAITANGLVELDRFVATMGEVDRCGYLFSPQRAMQSLGKQRRKSRTSKPWPSHDPDTRREHREQTAREYGDRYTVGSYRRSIHRACESVGIDKWSPNQLRHTAATRIAHNSGILIAQTLLGHADIKTTLRYAHTSEQRAIEAVASL